MIRLGATNTRGQSRKRLGEMLLEERVIDKEQLQEAVAQQHKQGGFIGQILVETGALTQNDLTNFLVKQCKIPHLSLLDYEIDEQALNQVSEELCLKYHVMPIDKLGRILTVAMVDPLDTEALEEVKKYAPDLRIKPMLCNWEHFQAVARRIFSKEPEKPKEIDAIYARFGLKPSKTEEGLSAPQATPPSDDVETPSKPDSTDVQDSTIAATKEDAQRDTDVPKAGKVESRPPFSTRDRPEAAADLAIAVRESIHDAIADLAAAVSKPAHDTALLVEAVQVALESALGTLADDLRSERKALREDLKVFAAATQAAEVSPDELAETVQTGMSHALQDMLGNIADELRTLGAAMKEDRQAGAGEIPTDTLKALQASLAEAAKQASDSVAEQLRAILLDNASKAPEPQAFGTVIRDSVGIAMDNMLEALSGTMRQLLETQQQTRDELPPPPDFEKVAGLLHDQLSGILDRAMENMSGQIQGLIEQGETGKREDVEALAQAVRESVATAVGAVHDTQSMQQEELTKIAQTILNSISRNTELQAEQRAELANIAQATLESLGQNRDSLSAQQTELANIAQATLESLTQSREAQSAQQAELAGVTRATMASIAENKEAQTAQQSELVTIARTVLDFVAQSNETQLQQRAQMESIATSTLESQTQQNAAQSAQQNELAAIARETLSALKQSREAQSQDQAKLMEAVQSTLESLAANKEAQAKEQSELGRIVQETLSSLADRNNAQQSDLARIADAILHSLENDKSSQSDKQDQLAQIAQASLESVRQTSQLIEAHTVAENNRSDLMRRRKTQHASVTSFADTATQTVAPDAEAYQAQDSQVRQAMESERPLNTLTFDNFFPGDTNAFTFKLGQAVAEQPGEEYNPLFLYGNVGTGKTHLISAIGNAILNKVAKQKQELPRRIGYISASQFSRRLAAAMADNAIGIFRDNYSHWDALILDDIQFLGGRVEAQEEFFHIFNVLLQEGRQIIIAGDKAPDRLGLLEQRLVSRFASGIVAELKAPEWDTRMTILRHLADASKTKVPEEVVSLVAMRVPADVRKMTGALRKIIAFARLEGNKISVEDAQKILSHLGVHESI